MLQNIRDRFTGILAVVIIGAIAVALTITLVDTATITRTGTFAARVNGEDIPMTDYRQVYEANLAQQQQATRAELSEEALDQLRRNVLEGMVRNRVVAQYVRDNGYRVSDQGVIEQIQAMPVFQIDGKFSRDSYLAALAGQNISTAAFENEQRATLEIRQLQDGVLESSFFTPSEFRRFVTLEAERRTISYALVEPDKLAAQIELNEDDIKAYYDAHPDRFESPESVSLDYVEAKLAGLSSDANVEEARLRALYEENPDRFRTAEQRQARHILVATDADTDAAKAEKLALELRERIAKGEDFAALARQYSDDPGSASSGGDLGWAGRGTYVPAFEEALFALDAGAITQPVKTEFGYHVIQLVAVRPGTQKPFDEVRAELLEEARGRDLQDRFHALTEKMDDAALENPGSLDAVAQATGLPVMRIEQFTRGGADPFGANPAVIAAAFASAVIEDGENSPLIEVGDGHAVVLRVTEHRPARLRSLEEVRAEVEIAARAEKAAQMTAERGGQLLDRLRAGADMATVSREAGVAMMTPGPIGRSATTVPPELLGAVFRAVKPADDKPSVGGLALSNGAYAVYRLEAILPGRPDEIAREQRDARKSLLARQTGAADATALAVDLRKQASVVVAPDLFAAEQQDAF
jgi:peptidyl-prolyl cis-trans isomerase D